MSVILAIHGLASGALADGTPDSIDRFLERHWQRPLSPQGAPPKGFTALEGQLNPESCGACHPRQWADWQTTRHSRAMGPGLMGQLLDMAADATGDHQSCLRCHAPLAEQASALVAELRTIGVGEVKSAQAGGLHRAGLICAACHVRQHQRFGPARRDGSQPPDMDTLPHAGWRVAPAFADSRFCAACHQFEPGDFALNGKLLENTYGEWRESRYAKQGVHCQECHMPDRRHLWRGIHDLDMVRSGVEIRVAPLEGHASQLRTAISLRNTGTGHYFPTYVTPQVVAQIFQEDAAGEFLDGTEAYLLIGRRVGLDLSSEIFDSRLAPDELRTLSYDLPRHAEAAGMVYRIYVEPDAFYTAFYTALLNSGGVVHGREALEQALAESRESVFTLFESRVPLKPARGG